MNTLFLVNEEVKPFNGVGKKILSQADALKSISDQFYFCSFKSIDKNKTARLINNVQIEHFSNTKFGIHKSLMSYTKLYKFIKKNNINCLYIRYSHFANPFFILFLKRMSSKKVEVFLEIPTYPYDLEYKNASLIGKVIHSFEILFRKYMGKYISHVVTFSDDRVIFNCPSIRISNGIDPKKFIDVDLKVSSKDKVHFIAVANLAFWHGYDRFINSLGNYVLGKHNDVFLHVVGDGPDLKMLKTKVEELGLNKYVKFYGLLQGNALQTVYNLADIGVDSLGRHRTGNFSNNSLKSKEYLGNGLPLLKSHRDTYIDKTPYFYDVNANDESFEIGDIVEWFRKSEFEPRNIQEFAFDNFSWIIQMNKIKKVFNENSSKGI